MQEGGAAQVGAREPDSELGSQMAPNTAPTMLGDRQVAPPPGERGLEVVGRVVHADSDTPSGQGSVHLVALRYADDAVERHRDVDVDVDVDVDHVHADVRTRQVLDRAEAEGQVVGPWAQNSRPNWTRQQTNPRPSTWGFIMERVTRIELALSAWEADVLPLNYTRVRRRSGPVSERVVTLPHVGPPVLKPWGPRVFLRGRWGCGGRELGRTVEGWRRVWVGSECPLDGRPFHPVMWPFVVRRAAVGRGSGEGTLGLDGAHRRPLCRWARVQHRIVPDAAGRPPRTRTARPMSAVCPAPQRRAGDS